MKPKPRERKNHLHFFKQIGSGCMMVQTEGLPCDAEYKCDCGVKFVVKTDRVGHMYLPESFMQMPRSEIKQAELDTMRDVDFGQFPPLPPTENPPQDNNPKLS